MDYHKYIRRNTEEYQQELNELINPSEMDKAIKSPSKHIPLARLKQIKQDHAVGEGGQEYSEEELNQEILNRQVSHANKMVSDAKRQEKEAARRAASEKAGIGGADPSQFAAMFSKIKKSSKKINPKDPILGANPKPKPISSDYEDRLKRILKLKKKDIIPGGLADDKTNKDFPKKRITQGRKVEMEHTSDPKVAEEIARDHLTEDSKYYDKLKTVEKKPLKKTKQEEFSGIWRHPTDQELHQEFGDDATSYYNSQYGGQKGMTHKDYADYVKQHGKIETVTYDKANGWDPHTDKTIANDEGYKSSWDRLNQGIKNGDKIPAIVAEKFVRKDGSVGYTAVSGRHRSGAAIKHGHPIQVISIPPIPHGKFVKSEPLMKPYSSEAQRRWAHTKAGTKALGGKEKVKEWDKESKGKDLPKKIEKMSRPRITFPNVKQINTRPDQDVQIVETGRQADLYGRKVANAAHGKKEYKYPAHIKGSRKVVHNTKELIDFQGKKIAGQFDRNSFGLNYPTPHGPKSAAIAGKLRSKFEEADDSDKVKSEEYKNKVLAAKNKYNEDYQNWRKKIESLPSGSTEYWNEVGNRPKFVKPKRPAKSAKATASLSPEKQAIRGQATESTIEHEGLHNTLEQIRRQHGNEAYRNVVSKLLSNHHPEALKAVGDFIADKSGYKRKSPSFDEEVLAHTRDLLVNPTKRENFKKYITGDSINNIAARGHGDKTELFNQYIKHLKRGHQKAYEMAQDMKLEDFAPHSVRVDNKPAASENMKKGSARRLFGKLNPEKLPGRDKVKEWQTSLGFLQEDMPEYSQEEHQQARSDIPKMESGQRLRALNKLANQTLTRRHPETGKRQFLLFRGMGGQETENSINNNKITHDDHSSWTPHLGVARGFEGDYYREDSSPSATVAAWVDEDNIHSIPQMYGNLPDLKYDMDNAGSPYVPEKNNPGRNEFKMEHEVIVAPHVSDRATKGDVRRHQTIHAPSRTKISTSDPKKDIHARINYRGEQSAAFPSTKQYPLIRETKPLPSSAKQILGINKKPKKMAASELEKAIDPKSFEKIKTSHNKGFTQSVDHESHFKNHPVHEDFANHIANGPTKYKQRKTRDGIATKNIYDLTHYDHPEMGRVSLANPSTYMVKPYHAHLESATKSYTKHPIKGWATLTTKDLLHAAGMGHMAEDVSSHIHDGVPVTVHKFSEKHEPLIGPSQKVHPLDVQKIAVMDFLTGNNDRHSNNVMISKKPNETGTHDPLLIDHERNFQYQRSISNPFGAEEPGHTDSPANHTIHSPSLRIMSRPYSPNHMMEITEDLNNWWGEHAPKVKEAFNNNIQHIKDSHLKSHIENNFNNRMDWLEDNLINGNYYDMFRVKSNIMGDRTGLINGVKVSPFKKPKMKGSV